MAKRTQSGAVRKVRRWCAHWFAMTDCFLIAPQRWVRIPPTCVKNRDTKGCLCFWQRMRDSIADLPEANRMERSALRRAARLHRSLAWRWVRIPPTCVKKQRHQKVSLFLAEDEGFEPPQTESESGVLPLHKSSICPSLVVAHKQHGYYTTQSQKVKHYFPVFQKNFSADLFCAPA